MLLRDSVHGLISFGPTHDALLQRLMDTCEVQRLRRIRALGPASLAFPGAEHSRFAHAIGAAHVMWRYLQRVEELSADLPAHERVDDALAKIALCAALLHDLGHGPYSHTFEEAVYGTRAHEAWTTRIILDPGTQVNAVLRELGDDAPHQVHELVHGRSPVTHLARAVSGTFDVDRCDYLIRDSHMTGVRYGLLDLDWLMASLRLFTPSSGGPARLAVDGEKGLTAVEGFFLARLYMYRQVYLHKAVRAAEMMIRSLVRRMIETGPHRDSHPVWAKLIAKQDIDVQEYLQLDDAVFERELVLLEHASDSIASTLAAGIRHRRLLKTCSLPSTCDIERASATLQAIVADAGFDPRYFCEIDCATIDPYTDDRALCVITGNHAEPTPLLDASPVLRGLCREGFMQVRAIFPAVVRAQVQAALLGC